MRSTKAYVKDVLTLTFTALLLRSAGVFFSARLSVMAGNAVMGLYSQIITVYAFAGTASCAGVNLGSMRIISECVGAGEYSKLSASLRTCLKYCVGAGTVIAAITFLFAPILGTNILGEPRSVPSFKALALALPFISVSNALHGYFNGVKQVWRSAVTSITEQAIRIGSTLFTLEAFKGADAEDLCLILVICNAASEAFSCLLLGILYRFSIKGFKTQEKIKAYSKKRFLGITLPIAASSLVRSGLTTIEHIMIPIGLKKSGLGQDQSMAQYGIISGMVLPVLLYPMALLSSFASITISELSARISAGESTEGIREAVTKALSFSLIYGIGCAAFIGTFANTLGNSIYQSAEAGKFIRMLAPLIFFMYLDHVSDGCLKGLDKQNFVMKVNLLDAALSVVFAIALVPKMGIIGFVIALYLCEILNCFFSFGMLTLTVHPRLSVFKAFIIPWASAILSTEVIRFLASKGAILTLILPLSLIAYCLILLACGALDVFTEMKAQKHCKAS